jgi:histone deacetylase HOS3
MYTITQTLNYLAGGSDSSGEYYITKHGIVKKPHAPLTSVPMDEDFDLQTQLGGGTTLGPASVWADRVRASTARDPREMEYKLEDTNETQDSWTDQREIEDDDRTARPWREYEDEHRDEAWTVPVETDIMTIPIETDAGTRYDGEWETVSSQGGANIAPPPPPIQQRRSPLDPRDKSLPSTPRTKTPSIRNSPRMVHSPASSLSQLRNLRQPAPQQQQPVRTALSNAVQPQQKGLEYEMLDNRVIENTPERTVTISSWREDVIRKSRPDVEMSVYYVSPDDYMEAERADSGIGMVDPPKSTASKEPENVLLSNGSTPKKKERRAKSTTSSRAGDPFRTSTPNRNGAIPFRATKSGGSTISTIPVESSVACDPILESSLSSCRPSLHHLSILLSELGIRTVDHLQAIARMSKTGSATAYQEVRKEAYQRGITVVEWAILMDKGREGT